MSQTRIGSSETRFFLHSVSNCVCDCFTAIDHPLGAVLDGPSEEVLTPLAKQALPTFLPMLKDPVTMVRDSAAWLLGHVFDLVSNVVDASNLNPILEALHGSLDDEPRVAKNACWVRSFNQIHTSTLMHPTVSE